MEIGIIGSGNGGTALAYDIASKNHEVMITDLPQFLDNVKAIKKNGGISAKIKGSSKENFVNVSASESIEEVLKFSKLIFISTPAYGTKPIAIKCKPFITKEHKIILCPGTIGGAFEFKKEIGYECLDDTLHVSETSTLPYAVRLKKPGYIEIHHFVKKLYFSTLPSCKTEENLALIRDIFPAFTAAENVMFTSLECGNPVIHPAVVMLNAGLVERTKGDFRFYADGITKSVGNLMRAVDEERIKLGAKLGLTILSEPEIGVAEGYMEKTNYLDGYNESEAFRDIMAPPSLNNRFMDEDIGYGLVFWSSLGKLIDVDTPVTDSMINIASVLVEKDYKSMDLRSVSKLNLTKEIINNI